MNVLELTSDEYHADPCDVPSLNSTTARLLLQKTPAHAKAQHPRLTEQPYRRDSDAFDMGTAVHQLLLRDDRVDVGDFKDYKTSAAQEWRDTVRAAGRVPMLAHRWEQAHAVAEAIREQMPGLDKPTPFTVGTPEATIVWDDLDGAKCRARLDWLRDDLEIIDDLKVTGRTADPRQWQRMLFNYGYDVQAAFYVRGVKTLTGHVPRFRWFVAETMPPYAVAMVQLSEHAMFAANVKVDTAISMWNDCLARDDWPAYPKEIHVADVPGWQKDTSGAWADVDLETVPF